MERADIIVIGAGMAGVSVAYELAADASVLVLEREPHPGYHATGRSAALFSEIYGNALVRRLARASRAFLMGPPAGFTATALARPRGVLFVAPAAQHAAFEHFRSQPDVAAGTRPIAAPAAQELVPILRAEWVDRAALEPDAWDLDVDALLQGYLRGLRARGAQLVPGCAIDSIERQAGSWHIEAGGRRYGARVLIDAAGAWADEIARLAGVAPLGVQPKRRTALLIDPPPAHSIGGWPMVIDAAETFYFKPDAGKLLLSPADETPSDPCDAQPDELDVAVAVDRFEQATTVEVRRVGRRWAGLRSFVADRSPVAGFDTDAPGFFWLAGQGGYGIQTAPALARASAAIALGRPLPADLQAAGITAAELSPARLAAAVKR